MVENLLETGTPFDYKDFDFSKADLPAIQVGEKDIPDRDNIYTDKTFEEED